MKLSRSSETGRDLTLGIYSPGDFFGEECTLDGAERFASAVALESSVLMAIPRAHVRDASNRDRGVALFLTRLLSARLRDSARQMEAFAWGTVPSRLAATILRLARPDGAAEPDSGRSAGAAHARLKMTHFELANLIGSTRETTTATLSAFRRHGWIDLVRREIVVLRPDLLAGAAYGLD
jgi:CRP/FNR family transcriptional regulator